jgi:hypothetical protein
VDRNVHQRHASRVEMDVGLPGDQENGAARIDAKRSVGGQATLNPRSRVKAREANRPAAKADLKAPAPGRRVDQHVPPGGRRALENSTHGMKRVAPVADHDREQPTALLADEQEG